MPAPAVHLKRHKALSINNELLVDLIHSYVFIPEHKIQFRNFFYRDTGDFDACLTSILPELLPKQEKRRMTDRLLNLLNHRIK